ncbi:uncharacterized protein QC761_0022130 [Podospora bellae-mahoneyi]|uniref:Uncharacterized protein n=1 Tax=Podospora bellae-mahoneyi TaxID=2093777 RepID=A0ABR0G1B0_9PEZI|nr:hypothetical protein QC761_0022130 [Podospora bellae-mahoneyi]
MSETQPGDERLSMQSTTFKVHPVYSSSNRLAMPGSSSSYVSLGSIGKLLLLETFEFLQCHAALLKLNKGNPKVSHLLDFLVLCSGFQNGRDVVGKAELLQCLGDVVTSDSLFGFLLRNLVCLARDESDELDTALYKEVAGLLGEGDAC